MSDSRPPHPSGGTATIAAEISSLYPRHFMRHYAYWKIRTDPVYPQAVAHLSHAPQTSLVDLGCGAGLFAIYLRKKGFIGPVNGVDLDPRKIHQARLVVGSDPSLSDLQFNEGNFNQWDPDGHQGHVTLLDVLQYLPENEQTDLLSKAANCLSQSFHRLILRNALRDHSWRSHVTVGSDHFAHWVRWMQNQPSFYPSKDLLTSTLENAGLKVTLTPLWGATPFNNYLVVAQRPN